MGRGKIGAKDQFAIVLGNRRGNGLADNPDSQDNIAPDLSSNVLSTDARIMIAKLSLTTGTSVRDLSHRGNRLGMSKREAILAINELIRAGLAKKAKMSSRLPSSVRRMETWYYLTDKGHEEFRNLYLSSSTNGPLYAAV